MTKRHLTIVTRESPLAMRQAEIVKSLLMAQHPHLAVELLGITTQGDKRLDVTLSKIGGKGLFVKELEEALLDGRADIAVHSMKDVPMELPDGLVLPVMLKREDPRDVFVSNQYHSLGELPSGAVVGTSSLRRQTQLMAIRSDVTWHMLRGNVNTRLAKLDQGEYDAIILAGAGLLRMGLSARIRAYLTTEQSLPAAGQGALGIECRAGDHHVIELIKPLNDQPTFECVSAERAVCRKLNGGCSVPIGAFAEIHRHELVLHGLVANQDGKRIVRSRRAGNPAHAEAIGERVAHELLEMGAETILKEFQ